MLYAEWSGRTVSIYTHTRQFVRRITVSHPVAGVQISGDSTTDAMIAIAKVNGKADLYKSNGQIVRRG